MQRRTFQLLVAGAAVSAAAAGAALSTGDRTLGRASSGERALPGLADKLGALGRMRITRGSMTTNFAMTDGHWTVVEKGNYPAADDRVRRLLVGLAELQLVEPKTDRAELLPRLDLDDPANGRSTLVAVQDRTGAQVADVVIGRRRPSPLGTAGSGDDAGLYIRKAKSDQAWLARGAVDVSGGVLDWLDRRVVDLPAARVAAIVLTAPDGAAAVLTRNSRDADFALDGAATAPDPKTVAPLAGALAALDLDDVKPRSELAIPIEGAATAAFTTFGGMIVGVRLSPPGDADWLTLDATGFGEAASAAAAFDGQLARWSYRIPADRAKLLRTTLADLRPHGS